MKPRKKEPAGAAVEPSAPESSEDKIVRLERELAQLRRQNEQLQMDREILEKAAAFFARESE